MGFHQYAIVLDNEDMIYPISMMVLVMCYKSLLSGTSATFNFCVTIVQTLCILCLTCSVSRGFGRCWDYGL